MEIKPHKFPPVKFEKKFDKQNEDLYYKMVDINSTRKSINSIHVLPNWAESIHERIVGELITKSIHGTLAIEGNLSTENEIKETLEKKVNINEIKERKEQERYNMKKAYRFIKKIGKKPEDKSRIKISEELIKEVHRIITYKTYENNNVPGSYRNFPVEVGHQQFGVVYRPPKCLDDIKMLMSGFTEWLNSEDIVKEYPVFRAILAHYYFAIIHPFGDGNGRTARAIESLILHNFGFKYGTSFGLWKGYYEHYEEYFGLLSKTRKENDGDQTELILFVLNLLQESVNSTYSAMIKMIDNLLFKDYMMYLLREQKLSPRQYAIVDFLLSLKKPMTMKEISEYPVIVEAYKGLDSRKRLFQIDMKKIIAELSLFKKVEKRGLEVIVPNYEHVLRPE